MKGVICYYSSTGNTEMICRYITRKVQGVKLDLFNIAKDKNLVLDEYDFVGFAYPVEFQGPPMRMKMFLDQLPAQKEKPVFVVSTYGLFYGRSMEVIKAWLKEKGFKIVVGHRIRMPENYPPLLVTPITGRNSPTEGAVNKLNRFILELNRILTSGEIHHMEEAQLKEGFVNSLIKAGPRTAAKEDMGDKFVDESLCTACGICRRECPYGAIELNPKPSFDMDKCYGCWSCFNHCPRKAIYTKKFRGRGHYRKPIDQLKRKFTY